MAQKIKIMSKYIPNKYKKYAGKSITRNSFKKGILLYMALLAGVLFTQSFGEKKGSQLIFLNIQTICIFIFLFQNIINYFLIERFKKYKKYFSIGLYTSAILSVFLMMAYISLLVPHSVAIFAFSILILVGLCMIIETIYIAIIVYSIKKENMNLRDATAQFLLNGVSILGVICILLSEILNKLEFGILGFVFMGGMILFLATFHFPRVLQYWKKPSEKDENISVYKNAINKMEKGKKKK
ncbi:hypothetical protein OKS_04536 [Enterococcus faecium EnGen0047]|uniref:hypothetical protein n=1 Tax=Enterococcus faecium TaxID=1352 RepID=UPI0002A1DFAB|nr:hypothetical protein [Enterococcus faecium]ELB59119.1 hypothetical protein OKS_04536 [Enterococcus faecium EnGen0047]